MDSLKQTNLEEFEAFDELEKMLQKTNNGNFSLKSS